MSPTTPLAPPAEPDTVPGEKTYRVVGAVSAVVAGTIHLAVAPEHFGVSWVVGTFFVVLAVAQFGLAVALRWVLGVRTLVGAIVASLSVIALYALSRTVDLPFLPVHDDAGHAVQHLPVAGGVGNGTPIFPNSHIEPVGLPDLVSLLAELATVVMLVGLLPDRARRVVTNTMLGLGVLGFVLRSTGLLS